MPPLHRRAPPPRCGRACRARAACAVAAVVLWAACRDEPSPPPSPPQGASPSARRPAPDEADPGELAEGKERAFELPIPRRMRVERRFPDAVYARGPVSREQVSNYVRQRVTGGTVDVGVARTVFDRVRRPGAPADLRIEVLAIDGQTQLLIRDVTVQPAKPGLTEEERWREVGLKPNGEPIEELQPR